MLGLVEMCLIVLPCFQALGATSYKTLDELRERITPVIFYATFAEVGTRLRLLSDDITLDVVLCSSP